ncbi:6-phosphogluconolactonase [Bifidobacterium pullorum subsp. saeculare]|uniref:6-phosphogluconolactonase n=1 Tax=Bifidobacterium pullorum subsp. saeculare TaxID=78257 RepID=A0A939B9F6_9BIFI|nr:6-phosphogluconolactonase [Bifidobacterium pullorum]MBM6698811.1 6-phosphogluconolactonase [Bifidobacterium pullorum subsp. saeculare]
MVERRLLVYPDPVTLAEAVAARTLLVIADTFAAPGHSRFDMAVTGGTDGNRVLAAIGRSPLAQAVDWSRVHFWWGDERFVPAGDADRNAGQARRELLDALVADGRLPEANIHEMPADPRPAAAIAAASPEETDRMLADAAEAYRLELTDQLGERPRLDLAQFGMGPDAHYASLFPGLPQIGIGDPHVLVAGVRDSPKPPPLRLTLTAPMIAASCRTWVFTSGLRKADAVARALAAPCDPGAPVSCADAEDELLWMVDTEAASRLDRD